MGGIRIQRDELSPEALQGIVEEFVTRDGTELSEASDKVRQVMALLDRDELEIWFDERSRTCSFHPST